MAVEWWYNNDGRTVEVHLEDGTSITVKADNRTGELVIRAIDGHGNNVDCTAAEGHH